MPAPHLKPIHYLRRDNGAAGQRRISSTTPLIRQEADVVRANLAEDSELDEITIGLQAWEWACDSVIAKVLLRQAAAAGTQPPKVSRATNKEVAEYYKRHQESFFAPEMVHAAHIVKNVDERVNR